MLRSIVAIAVLVSVVGCGHRSPDLKTVPPPFAATTFGAAGSSGRSPSEATTAGTSTTEATSRPAVPAPPPAPPRLNLDPVAFRGCAKLSTSQCYEEIQRTLALDVYRQVAESDSNFVISPLSLMNATAALYLGTSARTRTEFGHASHLDAIAARRLIAAAREVRSGWMNSRRGVSLGIEDTLISPPNADLRQAWLDQIARGWGVQHRQTQENVGTEWTRFDIVSRVEFKGKWQYAFDPSWTRDADFYGAHGQSEPVRMMRLEESLRYQPLPEAAVRLLGLPYRGGQLELVIVLPDEREGLWELERKLTPELLARFNPATKQKVDLYLPRFQLQSNIDLTEALGGLGVKRLWEQGAEFEAMFMHPSDTRAVPTGTQEAFMEVTEEGTVAAAITHYAVVDFADGHPSEQPIRFEVDHPFWVVLRHVQTKRILFMGRVVHPNYTPATDSTRTSPAPSRAPAAPTPRRRPPIDVGN